MIAYRVPAGVKQYDWHGRPSLHTPEGGQTLVDQPMLSLWRQADGRRLNEIMPLAQNEWRWTIDVYAGLACLAEAGLLERQGAQADPVTYQIGSGGLVSVILVSHNSLHWLEICLASLLAQTYSPLEIILVDNASNDGSGAWAVEHCPGLHLVQLDKPCTLATALNIGIKNARGEYFLLLNPDVELQPDAVVHLFSAVRGDTACAAVAAKLRLLQARAFLNGLGNYVGAFSWGADCGLGHLDLRQFDDWEETPSACFATALIPASAWHVVGLIDESFPMYYEDSEWCYRARLMGFTIRAAPKARVYHAFGGHLAGGEPLPAVKLRQVVYGRLRFITKLLSVKYFLRFFLGYLVEDCLSGMFSLFQGRWTAVRAYGQGWRDYLGSLPALRKERRVIQQKRVRTDKELFAPQKEIPMPLIQSGSPLLTRDIIQSCYLPLILAAKTRVLPEFVGESGELLFPNPIPNKRGLVRRALDILRAEGLRGLGYRIGKSVQWWLVQV